MPITIQVKLDTRKLEELTRRVPERVEEVLDALAANTLANATIAMSEPKTGRVYRKGKRTYQASAPGEAPGIVTSNLKGSVFMRKGKGWRIVGYSAEYAAYLEFGTSRMAPRPFLGPAVIKAGGDMIEAMRTVFT